MSLLAGWWLTSAHTVASAAEQLGPYEWTGITRIVAIGDVHGSYDKLVELLKGVQVVDEDLRWIGGDWHLVFLGDLTDRGPQERPVLDLVRRLETEAEEAGGRVHPLLGNHEVMNLIGDLRYAEGPGISDFLKDEQAADRQAGFQRFQSLYLQAGASRAQIRAAFDEHYPPGFFGRLRAFFPTGEYGAWLLEKPIVVKLNGYIFLHGGLTDRVAALGLGGINDRVHESLRRFLDNRSIVTGEAAFTTYEEAYAAAEALIGNRRAQRREPEKVAAAEALVNHFDGLAFAAGGPLWYRGNSVENERIERASMERVLESLEARAVVVAHTPTGTGQITSRLNGRILRTDVGMTYGRNPLCLVLRGEEVVVFNPQNASYYPPPVEPPEGERWPEIQEQLPDRQLERFLLQAKVTHKTTIERAGRRAEVWSLEHKGLELRSVFQSVDESTAADGSRPRRRYVHEVASYKLDRMMDLGLVPVTVVREHDGVKGSLQTWLAVAVDLIQIRDSDRFDLLEGLDDEIMEARIFNALIAAQERADAGKMVVPKEGRLILADNTKAFPVSVEIEDLLPEGCAIAPDFELEMRSLDQSGLEEELGAYLSDAQIEAMLGRRDRILEECSGAD